jgi:imidazolonepropionase
MSSARKSVVLVDATVATMREGADRAWGRDDTAYGLIRDAAVVVEEGRVSWVGTRADLPAEWRSAEPYSVEGRLITPGLVECSTHLLFAGDRRDEFVARTGGRSYEELADEGGGIRATATATREASDDDLLAAAVGKAWWFIRQGVTTLEVKTGYGLDSDSELRLLRIADRLRAALPIRVRITLLAGHTYPAGTDHEDYIFEVCDTLLPAAIEQGIFDFVEVYCEESTGISMEDASTILETVYRKKIPTRVSADHLSDSAGGALAPAFYSKVAAHLNFSDDIAVKAIGRTGTTAVLLPGSALELAAAEHRPPIELLRENGIPIAVSTGCNPGTSPLADLRVAAHLGCTLFGLTLPETLHGITSVAARALALDDGTGTLAERGRADLAVWDVEHPEELVYWIGSPTCREVWSDGEPVAEAGGHP